MSFNPYTRLRALFPADRLQVGTVLAFETGQASIALPDGSVLAARGVATVGAQVYVRGGLIESVAPDLPLFEIEI